MSIQLQEYTVAEGWLLSEFNSEPEQENHSGAAFALANGYTGYRADWPTLAKQFPSPCVIGGLAGETNPQAAWAPDGLWLMVEVGGDRYSVNELLQSRSLHLQQATLRRSGQLRLSEGSLKLRQERFVSAYDLHLLGQQTVFHPEQDVELLVEVGIRLPEGEAFWREHQLDVQPYVSVLSTYGQAGQLATALGIEWEGAELLSEEVVRRETSLVRRFRFALTADQPLVVEQLCSLYHDQDMARLAQRPRYQGTLDPMIAAHQDVEDVLDSGYLYARQMHEQQWERRWEAVDGEFPGQEALQFGLRFARYQQMIHTPSHAELPIGLYGLTQPASPVDVRSFLQVSAGPAPVWEDFSLTGDLWAQGTSPITEEKITTLLYANWAQEPMGGNWTFLPLSADQSAQESWKQERRRWSLIPFGLAGSMLEELLER